jgi:hypothetical protein
MGTVGDAYDDAMCESFFATLECKLLWRTCIPSQAEAPTPSSSSLKAGINPHRWYSAFVRPAYSVRTAVPPGPFNARRPRKEAALSHPLIGRYLPSSSSA